MWRIVSTGFHKVTDSKNSGHSIPAANKNREREQTNDDATGTKMKIPALQQQADRSDWDAMLRGT